jgi:SAM-dependent methyltransferase
LGIDIDGARLAHVRVAAPYALPAQADANTLPFPAASFDIVFCHFLLLWVANPARALAEMARVARPGGWVIALAEPDYGGRIDYPETLAQLGRMQEQALREQGAEPRRGRQLGALFQKTGLQDVVMGVLSGQWRIGAAQDDDWRQEWLVLEADLSGRLSRSEIERLQQIEADARRSGERVLFVPTFYAFGKKPGSI